MSLAPDTILSAESREALHDLVWSIPQNELLTYAATGDALMGGGFRKKNIGVVRARIMQVAEGSEPIDDGLRRLLVRHDPCASCLATLSVETVKENLESLAKLFGGTRLNLALLLDPRLPTLAQSCFAMTHCEDTPTPPREEAAASLREALAPLLAPLGAAEAVPVAFTPPAALKEARAEAARLKGADERLKKEQDLRKKAEDEARKWRERAEAAERETGPARQRAEAAEAARDRCLRNADAIADARLESRLAEEFAEWLGDRRAALVRETRSTIPAPSSGADPLLARAEAALAKQAQEDLVSGVRHVLQARLDAYGEAQRRCRTLIADAIRPTAELVAVERELDAEVRRIGSILSPAIEAPSANPEEALARAINTAKERELPGLANMVARLKALDIVTDAAASRLEEQVRNRYAECYAAGPDWTTVTPPRPRTSSAPPSAGKSLSSS